MKKIMLGFLAVIIMIGAVTAGAIQLANVDRTLDVDADKLTALQNKGLATYNVADYVISVDYQERCLEAEDAINTCQRFQTYYMNCSEDNTVCNRIDYTAQQILDQMNSWEEERINGIADAEIVRQGLGEKNKTAEGVTTLR